MPPHEKCSAFHDYCIRCIRNTAAAQVEVDDYRDYDKALGALSESLKYATMSQTPQGARFVKLPRAVGLRPSRRFTRARRRSAELEKRMQQVAQFVNVRTMHKTDPQGMISQCHRCSSV
jgi:hypothetical protein